jgi:hypothetical protein
VRLQDAAPTVHIESPVPTHYSGREDQALSIAGHGSVDPRHGPQLLYQANAQIEEIDTAENSIDGMGAIKFTDEEDWGYFGAIQPRVVNEPCC